MNQPGYIELERSLDSILVGERHRGDLGDIGALADSIRRRGLLQPLTVTPEGVLVCGARRLAALRRLGTRTVNVWVRAGVSDRLSQLLAEQDDNVLHKSLTPTESATLYAELKALLAEGAARRQQATRFGQDPSQPDASGAANVAGPLEVSNGDTRAQAAELITGRRSYTTLERIRELQHIADDEAQDADLRASARAELSAIDRGAPVMPAVRRITEQRAITEAGTKTDAADREASEDASASAVDARDTHNLLPTRAFVYLWKDLDGWWAHYDLDELAAELSSEQWDQFTTVVEGTARYAEQLRTRRDQLVHPPAETPGTVERT